MLSNTWRFPPIWGSQTKPAIRWPTTIQDCPRRLLSYVTAPYRPAGAVFRVVRADTDELHPNPIEAREHAR